MKRMTLIIAFAFITISTFYQGSKIYAVDYDFEGMYLAPKIGFYAENLGPNRHNYYGGAGIAGGFDLFRLKNPYPIPLRVEFEYMGRAIATNRNVSVHSVMVGAYYDLNLFYVRASELDTWSTKKVYTIKRPFMSLYVGMHLGAIIDYTITSRTNETIMISRTEGGISRTSLLFAANVGFAWHVTSWFTADLGYRILTGPSFRYAHEVLLSFRFTKP